MVASKLTATKVERYKPTKNDEILTDGNGLCLRFRRGQDGTITRTWLYTYRIGTKSIYLTLGEHNSALPAFDLTLYQLPSGARLTLDMARRVAAEVSDWRKRGLDPKQHTQTERERIVLEERTQAELEATLRAQHRSENLTVKELFDSWIVDGVRRKDGNAALKSLFANHVLPHIGGTAVKLLTEHDLRAVLRAQVDKGFNRTAVMTCNSLGQMFTWGRKRQPWRKLLVDGDPMDLIEIEKIVSPDYDLDNQSDRVLSSVEIAELRSILRRSEDEFAQAPNKRIAAQPLRKTTQCGIWIMLSTLCRVGEMVMARWEHVDFSAAQWFIPRENVKGSVADLLVYLSPFALEHFRQLYKLTGSSQWCYPGQDEEHHMDLKAITKQIGDRQWMFKKTKPQPNCMRTKRRSDNSLVLSAGKNGAWTPHDLRRTGATMMQALGVPLDTIDRCQNHVLSGSKVRRHYLHHDYANEKREAWLKLGNQLASILAPNTEGTVLRLA